MQTFTLTDEAEEKIDAWLKEIYAKAIAKQKEEIESPNDFIIFCWEEGYPYTGPIGGGLTYSFTNTSIGVVITVKESITGETLDISDYESW